MYKIFFLFFYFAGCGTADHTVQAINDKLNKSSFMLMASSDSGDGNEIGDFLGFEDCGYVPGEYACNFSLLNNINEEVNLYDYYGKTIILDFSTAWCYWCQQAAYNVPTILNTFEDEEFVYITLLVENWGGKAPYDSDLFDWGTHFENTLPVLAAPKNVMIDMDSFTGYAITGWPSFVFINKDMEITFYLSGYNQTLINEKISEAL